MRLFDEGTTVCENVKNNLEQGEKIRIHSSSYPFVELKHYYELILLMSELTATLK